MACNKLLSHLRRQGQWHRKVLQLPTLEQQDGGGGKVLQGEGNARRAVRAAVTDAVQSVWPRRWGIVLVPGRGGLQAASQ